MFAVNLENRSKPWNDIPSHDMNVCDCPAITRLHSLLISIRNVPRVRPGLPGGSRMSEIGHQGRTATSEMCHRLNWLLGPHSSFILSPELYPLRYRPCLVCLPPYWEILHHGAGSSAHPRSQCLVDWISDKS